MHPTRDFDTARLDGSHDEMAEQSDAEKWAGEPDFASVIVLGGALLLAAMMLLEVILASAPG